VGFTEKEAHLMTCVAKYESSFRTNAMNFNSNATIDRGLWQINTVWHNTAHFCSMENLGDPINNAKCARLVYEKQGITAWYAYIRNKKTCDKYKVNLTLGDKL